MQSNRNDDYHDRRKNKARPYGSRYADKNDSVSPKRNGKRIRRRHRRTGGKKAMRFCLLLFAVLIIAVFIGVRLLGRGGGESADGSSGFFRLFQSKDSGALAVPEVSVSLDSLYSPYAVLIDRETATIMASKRSDEVIYPASMTKILSVWVAMESIKNLDAQVTMSEDYYDELYAQNASQAGFEPGETTTIRDLLYGALLPSGAECCMQLAIEAAGSEDALVELMNQKVETLGLTQSHFTNCTGLHDEEQYTTVYEMALILRAALENSTFRTVFTTHYHVMSATDVHPDGFTVWSTFFKNVADEIVTGGEILGAKTGYTEEAGLCLATMAEVGDREYILVTAGWTSEDVGSYHILDAYSGYNLLGEALGYGTEDDIAETS
ncbi:MAG: D-alanyl-D-alanine carboxypeptidase [Lachnospiraceae bacterium]|nr:D-alanyl-D-alanine carboxypeptidase [Lachnospiraceae bacterium]